jgi:hypothetical protein
MVTVLVGAAIAWAVVSAFLWAILLGVTLAERVGLLHAEAEKVGALPRGYDA